MKDKIRHEIAILALLGVCGLASGCATVSSNGRDQVVLVQTEPAGAEVYYEGKKVGHSPMFLELDSEPSPVFAVKGRGQEKKTRVPLETSYRWRKSFFSNFALVIVYAPFGWLIDLLNGSAWEIKPPDLIALPGSQPNERPDSQKSIAIAPPEYRSFELSSQLGVELEKKLRETTEYQVFDYRFSEPYFYSYERTQGVPRDRETQEQLYSELENDLVVKSKAKTVSADTIVVRSKVEDVYTGEVVTKFKTTYKSDKLGEVGELSLAKTAGDYFYLLPNTFFVNFGQFAQEINIDRENYNGELSSSDSVFDQVGQVVERISLNRIIPIQNTRVSHWDLSFIPDFNFGRDRIQYKDFEPIADQTYERFVASVGYGGRLAYVSSWGMPYFDIIPHFGWMQISSSGGDTDVSTTDTFITLSAEFGYVYHLSRHWMVKAFSRSAGESPEIWEKVINETNNTEFEIESNATVFSGVSLGYRFDFGDQPVGLRSKK
ncbi:MAG: hypothetical protein AAF202_00160 [Pseudomonadota bacterium]